MNLGTLFTLGFLTTPRYVPSITTGTGGSDFKESMISAAESVVGR